MKKFIRNFIIIVYAIIAISVTVCLLSYNQYKVSEFGNKSLLIMNNNDLAPNFTKGQLVILDKSVKPNVGDQIFFYNIYSPSVEIANAKVTSIDADGAIYTITGMNGDQKISNEFLIGTNGSAVKIGGLGTVLGTLESKWGFLFLIVLPLLIAFLYEIVQVVTEMRGKPKGSKE